MSPRAPSSSGPSPVKRRTSATGTSLWAGAFRHRISPLWRIADSAAARAVLAARVWWASVSASAPIGKALFWQPAWRRLGARCGNLKEGGLDELQEKAADIRKAEARAGGQGASRSQAGAESGGSYRQGGGDCA